MQGALDFYRDLPVRPKRPERLFFGLFPDAETAALAGRCGQRFVCEYGQEERWLKRERRHVSLHHVGDDKCLRTKLIYAAKRAGQEVSLRQFCVTFPFIRSFEIVPAIMRRPRRCALVLLGEGEGLLELHRILGAAMNKNGLRAAEEFTPHMTLSYGPTLIPTQAIEPISFVVREFALIHSKLGLTQYEVIDRWALKG